MKRTGVYATQAELAEIIEILRDARASPLVTWTRVTQRTHAIAMAHGLPEIPGYYGLDAAGEFVEAERP